MDERVFEAMRPYFCERFGNANSVHSYGKDSRTAVDRSRRIIASALGVKRSDLFFTSGGTEANNWAVKCAGGGKKVLVSATEHPSVLEAARQTGNYAVIPVTREGIVTEDALKAMLTDDVGLVSVMLANNETGTVQNIKRLAEIAHSRGALFHTDAVQGLSCIKIDAGGLGIDLLSLSAHKIYGPKGIGALYVKGNVDLDKLIVGGHQERTYRGGTTNTPAVVGFANALQLTEELREAESARFGDLKRRFVDSIMRQSDGVFINGGDYGMPNIVNLRFDGVDGSALLAQLDIKGVAASAGAACSAGSVETSHVLMAMGLTEAQAKSSLRFSFGRLTTEQETDFAAEIIVGAVSKIRKA